MLRLLCAEFLQQALEIRILRAAAQGRVMLQPLAQRRFRPFIQFAARKIAPQFPQLFREIRLCVRIFRVQQRAVEIPAQKAAQVRPVRRRLRLPRERDRFRLILPQRLFFRGAARVRLAVLVDRGNPEFPIRADFVGFDCNPPSDHKVAVQFDADDPGENGIFEVEWKKY